MRGLKANKVNAITFSPTADMAERVQKVVKEKVHTTGELLREAIRLWMSEHHA